jgi:2'-5' RNA ligase
MPRLFTGLEVPESVALRLSLLRGGLGGARWIEPGDYHVTLTFVGEIDGAAARELEDELAQVESEPFCVRLTGLSSFGGDRPRALITSVDLTSPLSALQTASDRAVRRVGGEPERRRYTPHVTIARLNGVSAGGVAGYLGERFFEPMVFTVRRFVLYSARTSRGGGPYTVEAAYPLR